MLLCWCFVTAAAVAFNSVVLRIVFFFLPSSKKYSHRYFLKSHLIANVSQPFRHFLLCRFASEHKNQSIFAYHDYINTHKHIFEHTPRQWTMPLTASSVLVSWIFLACKLQQRPESVCDMTSKLVRVNYGTLVEGGKDQRKKKLKAVKSLPSCVNLTRNVKYQLAEKRMEPQSISFHHKKMNMFTFKFGYEPLM